MLKALKVHLFPINTISMENTKIRKGRKIKGGGRKYDKK
jgi:hypothetical protein